VRPSLAGLLGYASANGVAPPTAWRLYAASPVGFLPGVLDVGHQHADASWFPDGSIVAASAPVATPLICPTGNVRT